MSPREKSLLEFRINFTLLLVFNLSSYETSDGTSRQEQAELKNAGEENAALEVRGSYTWTAPDGQSYTVTYVADENGYRPEASHIPKAA